MHVCCLAFAQRIQVLDQIYDDSIIFCLL